jgi:hypothetical protein
LGKYVIREQAKAAWMPCIQIAVLTAKVAQPWLFVRFLPCKGHLSEVRGPNLNDMALTKTQLIETLHTGGSKASHCQKPSN